MLSPQLERDASDSARPQCRTDVEIQSLLKGLRIIEAINHSPGLILAQIAASCGLPRTTAHRALRTLEQSGFIYREAATARYYPHRRVLGLSCGFDSLAQVTALVREQFDELAQQVAWPLHFSTPQLDSDSPQMHVQASTDFVSPLAVEKLLPGRSIPLLQCAAGLAWLSTIAPSDRAPIIERAIRGPCEQSSQTRWTAAALEEKLQKTRERGYAEFCWPGRHTDLVGLSVPVQVDDRHSAALSVRFAGTAVPVRDAVARFVPLLRTVANRVSERLQASAAAARSAATAESGRLS
jgi:IclR family mhp operon transcriptional activator